MGRAVFLDRDGVLIEDAGLVTRFDQMRVLPGVPRALAQLKAAGFRLVVVTNQAVVARGLVTEDAVSELHRRLEARLVEEGSPALDGFQVCPHHPNATLEAYRQVCDCRKPLPGLLLQAARKLGLDLTSSFMVGDRPTDLQAGAAAGCRTVWVQTGQHGADSIEIAGPIPAPPVPDFTCPGLPEAARWILEVACKP